jgi:hypothetical protein
VKTTVITQVTTYFDILSSLLNHSSLASSTPVITITPHTSLLSLNRNHCYPLSDELLKEITVSFLQWLSVPQLEISLAVIHCINRFSANHWIGGGYFPINYLTVLTNAIINRLKEPTGFSSLLHKTDSTTTNNNNNNNDTANNKIYNKQQNLQRSQILLQDSCFNTIIDLYSSDHIPYHEIYQRLRLNQQLQEQQQRFLQRIQEGIFFLTNSEREQVEETNENISAFLEYKTNFRG